MGAFATLDDVERIWRPLKPSETSRAEALLELITAELIERAKRAGKDLEREAEERPSYSLLLKSVTCDVLARTLLTSTEGEPMTQRTESAGGYSVSGTFLVPGGGLFIKRAELAKLGIGKQRFGMVEMYDMD